MSVQPSEIIPPLNPYLLFHVMGNCKKRSPTRQNSAGNKLTQLKPNTDKVDRVYLF